MKWAILVERVSGSSYIIEDEKFDLEEFAHNWAQVHVPASTYRVLPMIKVGDHMPG